MAWWMLAKKVVAEKAKKVVKDKAKKVVKDKVKKVATDKVEESVQSKAEDAMSKTKSNASGQTNFIEKAMEMGAESKKKEEDFQTQIAPPTKNPTDENNNAQVEKNNDVQASLNDFFIR